MKKYVYLGVSLLVAAFAFGIIMLSDSAVPGDFLYVFDRQIEKAQIGFSKLVGKVAYARLNLDLAGERLTEIQSLSTLRKPTNVFIFKANAQSTTNETSEIDSLISQLITDFKFNIQEVTSILGDDAVNSLDLSKYVAEKTSEFSSEILTILPKLETKEITEINEISDDLEDLDENAVDTLIDDENNDEDSEIIATEKVSKTILKVVEKVASLQKKLEEHKEKMTSDEIKTVVDGIALINTKIDSAKTLLSQGNLADSYSLLKEAKDDVSKLRDLVEREQEQEQEQEQEREQEQENEQVKTQEKENEDDSQDDEKDDSDLIKNENTSKTNTSKQSNESNKNENENNKNEDDNSDDSDEREEPEDSEDEEDVEGVTVMLDNEVWINFVF